MSVDALGMGKAASDYIYETQGVYIAPELLKAQLQHETGNFNVGGPNGISPELFAAHNYAGISTSEETSLPRPANEGGYYKEYGSDEEFAKDWSNNLALYAQYWKEHGGTDRVEDPKTFVDLLIADPNYQYFRTDIEGAVDSYINNIAHWSGVDAPDISSFAVQRTGPWGMKAPYNLPQSPTPEKMRSFWEEFSTKMEAAALDGGLVSVARSAYFNFITADNMKEIAFNNYKPSQEDIDLVQNVLKDDNTAQQFVLTQATSRKALMALLEMKRADIERQKEVDQMSYGLSTIGTVLGSVLDPSLLLAFIPGLGGASMLAKGAQIASRMGKLRALVSLGDRALNASKVARFAANALTTSVAVGADRFLAERYGGFKPDYEASMALGGFLGGLGVFFAKHPNALTKELATARNNMEDNVAAIAVGAVPPAEGRHNLQASLSIQMEDAFADTNSGVVEALKHAGDSYESKKPTYIPKGANKTGNASPIVNFAPVAKDSGLKTELVKAQKANANYFDLVPEDSIADRLVQSGNLFIIPEASARKVAERFGVSLDKDAKAFSIPNMGISVIFKDKVDKSNLMGVVMHEVGVHRALNRILPQKEYDEIMGIVRDRMRNSKDPRWIKATRAATNEEEALAYWIEQYGTKGDRLTRTLKSKFSKVLLGSKATDADIENTILKAVKRMASQRADKQTLAYIVKSMTGTKNPYWKAAKTATSGKPIQDTFKYWLDNYAIKNQNSKLFKDLKKQALAEKGVANIPAEEVIRWAKDAYVPELTYIHQRVYAPSGAPTDSPLMKLSLLDDAVVPKAAISQIYGNVKENVNKVTDELLKRRANDTIKQGTPITHLSDGSMMVGDIHYSKQNAFGTIFDEWSDSGKGAEDMQKGLGIFSPMGLKMENSIPMGTVFGIMANSHSPTLQKIGKALTDDARMRGTGQKFTSASDIKQFLMDRWMGAYQDIIKERSKYIRQEFGLFNFIHRNNYINQVNRYIIDCHNAMARGDTLEVSKYPAEIQKMAHMFMNLREDILTQCRKNSDALGGRKDMGSLIEKDWSPISSEFYRVIDNSLYYPWASKNFNNIDNCYEFLKNYAKTFMDTNSEKEFFLKQKRKEFDEAVKEWKRKGSPEDSKPEWKDPTDEELEAFFNKEAENWAYGLTDRDASSLNFNKGNAVQNFKHRVAIDTSGSMMMPNGLKFSFDKDLRNYDIDTYVPQIFNRISGEAGLHAVFGDETQLTALINKAKVELAHLSPVHGNSRELEALELTLNMIRGKGTYNLYNQRWADGISSMIRSYSYAVNGGNFTFAQLGEYGGAIAYGGAKVLLDAIPKFGSIIKEQRLGRDGKHIVDTVTRKLWADDINAHAWEMTNSTESHLFRETMDKVSENSPEPTMLSKALDAANRKAKQASLWTSTINMMPKLTDHMIRTVRAAGIEDSMRWAMGKEFSWRNPFSAKKFSAVGVNSEKGINAIRQDIKKYLVDGKGDWQKWWDENPDTFFQWKRMMDNYARRGITQNTIGNTNPFKEKHRLLFQFKDFALKAVNNQFMRALQQHEADDALAALFSMATNSATYYALTLARSYAYYGDDEEKRQAYMEKQGSLGRVLLAGFTRMSLTAPVSFAMDGIEMLSGYSGFRTSVDNTKKDFESNREDPWSPPKGMTQRDFQANAGRIASQFPAVNTVGRVVLGVHSLGRMVANGFTENSTTSQRDVDNVIKAFPASSWVGMSALNTLIQHKSGLPEKEPTQKTQEVKKGGPLGVAKTKTGKTLLGANTKKSAKKSQSINKLINNNK